MLLDAVQLQFVSSWKPRDVGMRLVKRTAHPGNPISSENKARKTNLKQLLAAYVDCSTKNVKDPPKETHLRLFLFLK